jgi:hypothetical protein
LTGYSGTPLAAKLGIKAGKADIVHHFADRKSELAAALRSYRKQLGTGVPLWVSWPKKSARVPTDITEDTIREVALPLGFVEIKVCAVSETWSGLKLVVRRELR